MRRKLKIITVVLFTIFQSISLAQDPFQYGPRGDNREEGRKAIGISAPDLELLSFIGYCESVDSKLNVDLKILFYLPMVAKLYIRAKELKVKEYYLMKPRKTNWQKGWQEFSPWPTKDVLQPLRISIEDLGIVGRVNKDREGSGVIAPLIVYHNKLPAMVDKYTLHLFPLSDLRRMEYKLYEVKRERLLLQDQIMNLFGGVPFSLNIDLSKEAAGYYKLILDCKYKNVTGGPQRTYYFYHQPNVSPKVISIKQPG